MTLASELAALAATFPNPAFDAKMAAKRTELDAGFGSSQACYVALFTSASLENDYKNQTNDNLTQANIQSGKLNKLIPKVAAQETEKQRLQDLLDALNSQPPPPGPGGIVASQSPMPGPGSVPVGTANYPIVSSRATTRFVTTGTLNATEQGQTNYAPYPTFQAAFGAAVAGDHIILKAGTYHVDQLFFGSKGVIIQNAPNEAVWFDGSYQVSAHGGSQNMNANAFGGSTTPWSNAGQPANVYAKQQVNLNDDHALVNVALDPNYPLAAHPELVMYNPAPTVFGSRASQMVQVASVAALNSQGDFYYDPTANTMYIYGNPTNWDVWIAHDQWAFDIGGSSTIRGIGFRRYMTPPSGFGVVRTTATMLFENCWFEDLALQGIFWHNNPSTVRLCTFLWCGKIGWTATNADGSLYEYNEAHYNNVKHFQTGQEAGGGKFTKSVGVLCHGNDHSDNWGHGIWFDVYSSAVINRNIADRCESNGIMFEISDGATIVGNQCCDCGNAGISVSTSRNTEVYNNTLLGNHTAALIYEDGVRADAGWDASPPSGPIAPINCKVRNNVMASHASIQNHINGQANVNGYLINNWDVRGTRVRRWDANASTYTVTGTGSPSLTTTERVGMNLTTDRNAFWRRNTARTTHIALFVLPGAGPPGTGPLSNLAAMRASPYLQEQNSIEATGGSTNPWVSAQDFVYNGPGPMNGVQCSTGSYLPIVVTGQPGVNDRGILPTGNAFVVGGSTLESLLGVTAGSSIDIGAVQATVSTSGPPPPTIDQQITTGRNILLVNRHHLLPNNADYTGATNATPAIAFTIAGATQGTAAAPRTIDYWPGASYLQEDELVIAAKNYTTINLHGATVAPKPPIDLGTCTIPAAGSVDVTSAGGAGIGPWQTADLIGRTFIIKGGAGAATQSETMIVGVVAGGVLQGPLSGTHSLVFRLQKAALAHSVQPAVAVSGGIPPNYLDLTTFPRVANRKGFTFSGCDHCRLTGQGSGGNPAQYVGAVPDTWNNAFLPTVPNAEPDLAGQAFLGSFGSTQLEVDNLILQSVWGDVARIGALTVGGSTSESAVVNVHDIVGDRIAQNAMLPVRGAFITMQDCKYTNLGRGGVELITPTGAAVNGLNVLRTHFGLSAQPCMFGSAAGAVNSATVTGNVGEGRPFDVRVAALSYASLPWADWKFDANVGFTAPISNQLPAAQSGPVAGSVVSVDGVKNLTYTNNVQDFLQVSRANFMVHVIGEHITGTTNVANNTGAAARAQGKLNGTFTGGIVGGGRVGIPAVGCVFGGAVDDLASGNATPAAIVAIESQFGFKLGADRVYVNPTQNLDPTTKQALLDANKANNRISVISFNIPTGLNWYTLAADTTRMQNCCNSVRDLTNTGYKMMVILDHEPDVNETPGNGVAVGSQASRLQYAALQTAFMTRMKATAPLATRALCLGGSKLGDGRHTLAQTLEWLPTDRTLLEVVGHDPYNMSQTPGGPSFASLCTNYWRLLSSYGTPGAIFEFGITLSAGGRVAWWKAAMAHLQLHPECKLMLFFNSHVGPPFIDPVHDFAVTELFSPAPGIASASDGAGQSYFLKGG